MPKKQTTPETEVAALPIPITRKRTTSLSGMLAAEPPETQKMLRDIAKMVEVFKTEINEDPAIVAYLMRKVNPIFTNDILNAALYNVQDCLFGKSEREIALSDSIENLQGHYKKLAEKDLIFSFETTMFNSLAYGFCPSLPWRKIVFYGAWLSQK